MNDKEDEARIKAYMAAKMTHIKMYNECMNLADGLDVEKFAELVRADEREACAKVVEDTLEPWLINEYIVRTTEAIQARGNDLQTAIDRGTKAWADVPNATEWVEELRGNDTPEVTPEVPCKTDPRAPHGFNRNASFDEDRYVCDCEFWEPEVTGEVDAVNMSQDRVDETAKGKYKACYEIPDWRPGMVFPAPKKEWVGLSVNEARKFYEKYTDREELIYAIDEFLEEKNT